MAYTPFRFFIPLPPGMDAEDALRRAELKAREIFEDVERYTEDEGTELVCVDNSIDLWSGGAKILTISVIGSKLKGHLVSTWYLPSIAFILFVISIIFLSPPKISLNEFLQLGLPMVVGFVGFISLRLWSYKMHLKSEINKFIGS